MLILPLDTHWTCGYFEFDPDLFETQRWNAVVPRLRDWRFEQRYPSGWTAWLERRFALVPTSECVRYQLSINAAPNGAQLSINGHKVGTVCQPTTIDITELVMLDDNRIAFRIQKGAEGGFGEVKLAAVACE